VGDDRLAGDALQAHRQAGLVLVGGLSHASIGTSRLRAARAPGTSCCCSPLPVSFTASFPFVALSRRPRTTRAPPPIADYPSARPARQGAPSHAARSPVIGRGRKRSGAERRSAARVGAIRSAAGLLLGAKRLDALSARAGSITRDCSSV
jgi:hypothetical protein